MSRDFKEIGYYPQTSVTEDNELFSPFSNVRLTLGDFPNVIPRLCLLLNKRSKITDFLDTINPPFGLIVNEKLKQLILDFKLPPNKFYTANITHKNKPLNYYWFHLFDDLSKYVDLNKTTVEIFHKFNFKVLDRVLLKSEKHLKEINSNLGFEKSVRLKELYFNNTFPKYDIFVNNIIGFENIISERLFNALQENNITGYEASPCNIIKE
jgi:hypothetical protein